MDWKESILSQRNRVAFWAPFIAIILLFGIETLPFAKNTNYVFGNEEKVDDSYMDIFYQDDFIIGEVSSEDYFGEGNDDFFGGETGIILEYDETP